MKQRELKFRVWDGNKMQRPHDLSMNMDGELMWQKEVQAPGIYLTRGTRNLVLMQYTGLKDKNGVEIYEGDVVTASSQGYTGRFEVRWRQEGSPCWILFPAWQDKTMWHISATEHAPGKHFIEVTGRQYKTDKTGFYDDGLEVIGNIHQNPELIQL